MLSFYRLSRNKETPTHHAYTDAWIRTNESCVIDNRLSGFQVWGELARAVFALTGVDCDGSYDAEEYRYLLLIDASDCGDSDGEWFSVQTDDVVSVKSVLSSDLLAWAYKKWQADIDNGFDAYEEDDRGFEGWCEDSEKELEEWIFSNAKEETPNFVNTLPNPYAS